MSDRFPAKLFIGGKISRTTQILPDDPGDDTTVLEGLISALEDDGASHAYGENCIDSGLSADELVEQFLKDGFLTFECDQARNGEFEQAEEFCQVNNIPFDRWSDHYCEWDAENVFWRPGMNRPVIQYADSRGDEIVDGATVRKALELVKKFAEKYDASDRATDWDNLGNGIQMLEAACPREPDALEKFELVKSS